MSLTDTNMIARPALHAADAFSGIMIALSWIMGGMTPLAALATALGGAWYMMQLYESKTVQKWLRYRKRHVNRKAKRTASTEATDGQDYSGQDKT